MISRRRAVKVLIAIFAMVLVLSCAMTPKQKQLMTFETFNSVYKQYLDAYDRQDDATKAKWKAEIDPYWKDASAAVDAYMAFSDPTTTDAQAKLAIYNAAKKEALRLLLTYGVEIKEE